MLNNMATKKTKELQEEPQIYEIRSGEGKTIALVPAFSVDEAREKYSTEPEKYQLNKEEPKPVEEVSEEDPQTENNQ
jgi:hypothetical protein